VAVELEYPKPITHEEVGEPPPDANASLTARPARVRGGEVTFLVNGHRRTVHGGRNGIFRIHASPDADVKVAAGDARDRFGNYNGRPSSL